MEQITIHRKRCAGLVLLGGVLFAAPARGQAVENTAWEILVQGAAEKHSVNRAHAIAALGTIGARPEVVERVEEALADKDPAVRQIAAATLGEMKARDSVPKLRQALDDKAQEVCFAAAKALWDMGDRSGRNMLVRVLAREQAGAQGVVGSNVADARKMMQNPSELALMGIKEGASFFGPFGMGISLVEELKKDRSAPARALAATMLTADEDPHSVTVLEAALADKNWIVRASAAKALGSRGTRQSIAKLEPLLKDAKYTARYMAAAAIVRLSHKA